MGKSEEGGFGGCAARRVDEYRFRKAPAGVPGLGDGRPYVEIPAFGGGGVGMEV